MSTPQIMVLSMVVDSSHEIWVDVNIILLSSTRASRLQEPSQSLYNTRRYSSAWRYRSSCSIGESIPMALKAAFFQDVTIFLVVL